MAPLLGLNCDNGGQNGTKKRVRFLKQGHFQAHLALLLRSFWPCCGAELALKKGPNFALPCEGQIGPILYEPSQGQNFGPIIGAKTASLFSLCRPTEYIYTTRVDTKYVHVFPHYVAVSWFPRKIFSSSPPCLVYESKKHFWIKAVARLFYESLVLIRVVPKHVSSF